MKTKLHPGSKWNFRLTGFLTFVMPLILVGSWIIYILATILNLTSSILVVVFIIIALGMGEVFARLSYKNWSYDFTEDGLKLERGIIWKKFSTVPYEKIQNVDIERGLIARIFGFSTVNIHTAGYSAPGKYGSSAEGHIPGVDPHGAEKIREYVLKRIGKRHDV
jgi:membrane protein YdbS with pleckstrin-like domain